MRTFKIAPEGYDKSEVQAFINEVTKEYESMLNKLKEVDVETSLLKHQLEDYKKMETALNKAVLVAEDSSNQIKKIAKEEAEQIISNAKKNASHIINDALIKAEQVEKETDQLKRSLKIYKSRIQQAINEQLVIVEDVDRITDEFKDQ
ncbi:MAG TPA: hypothetical protein DCE23_00285 [Firmicutes bacterium]|nr:hypothetical protein [Bacillota bacterium]